MHDGPCIGELEVGGVNSSCVGYCVMSDFMPWAGGYGNVGVSVFELLSGIPEAPQKKTSGFREQSEFVNSLFISYFGHVEDVFDQLN